MTLIHNLLFLTLLITVHTIYIEANKELDLTPPATSNTMNLERSAQILKLKIFEEKNEWLNQEVSCGPCAMTRNTIGNILSVTSGCLVAAINCYIIADNIDGQCCSILAPLTTPIAFTLGGMISETCYSIDQSEKEQQLANIKHALEQKNK